MRKWTIVAAALAATVTSAEAAPNIHKTARGTMVQAANQSKSEPAATLHWQATLGRSARPAEAAAPVPTAKPARAARAAASTRGADGRRLRARSYASRGAAHAKSRPVALTREIPSRRIERPAETAAVAAPSGSIQSMVTAEAQRAGVNPALGHAVVKVESMYRPNATGRGGYIGLMQLSYQTARGMGYRGSRAGLYEPSTNLRYGMRYLAGAVSKAGGSTCGAVSKYQGGHAVKGVTSAGAVYCGKVRRHMASR